VKRLNLCNYDVAGDMRDIEEDDPDISVKGLDLNPYFALLCNPNSIDAIFNSDHVLQKISTRLTFDYFHDCDYQEPAKLPQRVIECLHLNKNTNEAQVVRDKVIRYHLVGEFDVSPYTSMTISVLPKLISVLADDRNDEVESSLADAVKDNYDLRRGWSRLTYQQPVSTHRDTLFRLVKNLPNLCNVSSRAAESSGKRKIVD
jgi:hypothetical protein